MHSMSRCKLRKIFLLLKLKRLLQEKEANDAKKKKNVKRSIWVKPLLMKRSELDIEAHLLNDLLWDDDEKDFSNFCRMKVHQFEAILLLVEGEIKKKDTQLRAAIPARTKLAITLRYLATGDSFRSFEFLTRVARSTISLFIPIVTSAIYLALKSDYLKVPDTEGEWLDIAKDFNDIWQFPHTVGALDGKHIRIKAPANSGSQFYNFKGFFSIVLFAAVDAHCRFTYVDVGANGKASDSTIYRDSYLFNSIQNEELNIPRAEELVPGRGDKIPYFFIGDDAFSLDKHVMKPFSRSLKLSVHQEIFNYRLCRARMVVECAFGRLAKRFAVFNRPIEVSTSTIDKIVLTTCVLHNYLTKQIQRATTQDIITGNEGIMTTFTPMGQQQSASVYKYANRIRDEVTRHLITDGNVDFQWRKVNINR